MERLSLPLLVMITLNGACGAPTEPLASEDDAGADASRDDAGAAQPAAPPPVRVGGYCVRSSCTGCLERQQIAVDSCYDCAGLCTSYLSETCLAQCREICRRANAMTCDAECTDPVCYHESVSFSLDGEPDETIRAACIAANMRCAAPERLTTICDIAAKVESRVVLSTYRCLETKACTVEAQTPCIPASRGTLRAWYCDALATEGGSCSGGDVEQRLDAVEPWLRDDVLTTVEACTAEFNAEDLTACVVRWLRTVGG